jgi:hypothetical protein
MKTTLTMFVSTAIIIFFAFSSPSFCQTSDTVMVYANPVSGPTIDAFIMADTTADGQRVNPNRVYLLQQNGPIDTVYYYDSYILAHSNITIIGKTNPVTGMPPVIAPGINSNNSSPNRFIQSQANNSIITLKNLYFFGLRPDGKGATAHTVWVYGDSSTVILDHCVNDAPSGVWAYYLANWGSLYMTNCEYRNAQSLTWTGGMGLVVAHGITMDTAKIVNNTFFCVGRGIYYLADYCNYLDCEHNTVFLTTGWVQGDNGPNVLTNGVIRNNIYYGTITYGQDSAYIAKGGCNAAREGFGIIMADSLGTIGTTYGITEAQRNIDVENNAYFWPQEIYNFWSSWNDTASDKVVPPQWMNPQTAYMFQDKTDWPGLQAVNNDSVDPGFASSLVTPALDSLVKFVGLIGYPTGNTGGFHWYQLATNPDPTHILDQVPSGWAGWSSGYPVPENLRYSNTALQHAGTDGKALGDLNWFPEQLTAIHKTPNSLPGKFELSQNYPNPFNPSTIIAYSLPEKANVELKVYNVLGETIATLVNQQQLAGEYKVDFDAKSLSSGVYFYTLKVGNYLKTKKMILLK